MTLSPSPLSRPCRPVAFAATATLLAKKGRPEGGLLVACDRTLHLRRRAHAQKAQGRGQHDAGGVHKREARIAQRRLFADDVALALEEDYPVYTTFVQMPGVNDTVQVYVVTTIVEELNADARNMRHIFPYRYLVEQNILPAGLDRAQQHAFYNCLAGKINNRYATMDQFVDAVLADTTGMSQISVMQQQCASDLFDWTVVIEEFD